MSEQAARSYEDKSHWQKTDGLRMIDQLDPKSGQHVLDIGCGTGGLTVALADRVGLKGSVLAIDPDLSRLKLAAAEHAEPNIEWMHTRIGDLVMSSNHFDIGYSNYVLHWLDAKSQKEALSRIHQLLRPGGRFGFTVIARVPEIVQGITRLIGPDADRLLNCFCNPTLADWKGSLEHSGFTVEMAERATLDVNYGPLEEFFAWWVGTSHGTFTPDKIAATDLAALRRMFPGDLLVDHPVLRFVVVK